MTAPSVSVVVTCYNYARYVAGAVRSALAQTVMPLEVIVVDDGSTDDTAAVMEQFRGDPRVRFFRQANGGQANAKNNGIRRAAGALIAFLDADDLWRADKLERQLPLFADPAVGVVYSEQEMIRDDGTPDPSVAKLPRFKGGALRELLKDNFIPFSSAVVRRACLDEAGLFDESLEMAIDWDLWLRVAVRGHAFDYSPEPLLLYRIGHAGQMSKNLVRRQACCERIYQKMKRDFADRIPAPYFREADVYTWNHRGYFYRARDLRKSLDFYARSIRRQPLQWAAWRGLLASLAAAAQGGR